MDITEVSILHHVAIALMGLWLLSVFNCCNLVAYFVALAYLYKVHESYVMRLRRKLQSEERKQANQRRVLSDSETVRWLNHAVENIWPICMEQIASQQILLPIIPWFLQKYKPWTAKKVEFQHLYLGRNPPTFTEMRVRQCNDDHLVIESGMNFLAADDMSAVLAVKLRKRLGFGMWATLYITGIHIEGKVLVGLKFIQKWPFLSRLRVRFVEPPYFQVTVKPMSNVGIDVADIPGISGWMENLLSVAFEQNLVEPNMLVVDVNKFASPKPGKGPVAYAKIEVVEASGIRPSDQCGCWPFICLADLYVKGRLNGYKFKTKPQMKTLTPKWLEEFKIPIVTWESPNVLAIDVCDKDLHYDDCLGDLCVNVSDFRGGQKHDIWLPIEKIKSGKLHLAITILDDNDDGKGGDDPCRWKSINNEARRKSFADETVDRSSLPSALSEKSQNVTDNFEPIDIEGQKETGIWVHHPGSEISQTWTSRKGKSQHLDTEIQGVTNDLNDSSNSNNNCSSPEDNPKEKRRMRSFKRGLHKIGAAFSKSSKREEQSGGYGEVVQSPHAKETSGFSPGKVQREGTSTGGSGLESPSKGNVKDTTKSVLKSAEKSRSFKKARLLEPEK